MYLSGPWYRKNTISGGHRNVKMIKIKTEIVSSLLFGILHNRSSQLWKLNDFITMPQLCIKITFYHLIYDKVGLCRHSKQIKQSQASTAKRRQKLLCQEKFFFNGFLATN